MLCGAHDVSEISDYFFKVCRNFGATPLFYKGGKMYYQNSLGSNFADNSRKTVEMADVCVFVILKEYGEITWGTELLEALQLGKPFVILILASSSTSLDNLKYKKIPPSALEPKDQKLLEVSNLMDEYQLSPIVFGYKSFKTELTQQLSMLGKKGLKLYETQTLRKNLISSIKSVDRLTTRQIIDLKELAADDEVEDKFAKKIAIRKLAECGVRDDDFVINICRSSEQGVQRLAFNLFPALVELPLADHLLDELATIASQNDDVGIARRLVMSVAAIDPEKLLDLLEKLDDLEVGVRRRAFEGFEANEEQLLEVWGKSRTNEFLAMCEAKTAEKIGWLTRLRAFIERLRR